MKLLQLLYFVLQTSITVQIGMCGPGKYCTLFLTFPPLEEVHLVRSCAATTATTRPQSAVVTALCICHYPT